MITYDLQRRKVWLTQMVRGLSDVAAKATPMQGKRAMLREVSYHLRAIEHALMSIEDLALLDMASSKALLSVYEYAIKLGVYAKRQAYRSEEEEA